MKTPKYLNKILLGAYVSLVFGFALFTKQDVLAAPSLPTNTEGYYCIGSAEDYNTFLSDVCDNQEEYEGKTVLITKDISVEGREQREWLQFKGVIDGQNHTIEYTADNKKSGSELFPFYKTGATIKNMNIIVHERLVVNNQFDDSNNYNHAVFGGLNDAHMENVQLSGEVSFVYNRTRTTISLCALNGKGSSEIKNCSVNLTFDYDKDNSDTSTMTFSKSWSVNIGILGYYGSQFLSEAKITNFYSSSTISQNLVDLAEYIETNAPSNRAIGLNALWMVKDGSADNLNNVYFDKDKYPLLLKGPDGFKNNISLYIPSNNDSFGRTTADMKLQSTYSGFDFDDTWAISDKVNDGYPFIVAEDVKAVKKLIADLPAQITDADKDAVKAAKDAYDALTDDQKLQLSADTVQKLNDAVKAIEKEDEPDQKDQEKKPETQKLKKGTKFTFGANKYQVTGDKTATFIGAKNKKVKKITVPTSVSYKKQTFKVTAIGPKACKGYKKLTTFVVGKNVKAIGAQAFANTPRLKKLQVKSMALKKVGAKACKGMHKKGVIKVPKKMLKKYKKLFKGKGQKKTVKIK